MRRGEASVAKRHADQAVRNLQESERAPAHHVGREVQSHWHVFWYVEHLYKLFDSDSVALDTYTVDELKQASMWCLKDRKTAASLLLGVRDRCMLLLSTSTAFRGDSSRSLLFSDLSMRDVPMPELSDYMSGTTAAIEVRRRLLD